MMKVQLRARLVGMLGGTILCLATMFALGAAQDPFGAPPDRTGDTADDLPAPSAREESPMDPPRAKLDSRVQVHLKDGSKLVGELSSGGRIHFRSFLGEVELPLAKVSGVLFHKDATRTVVTFRNGDRLTGEWLQGKVRLKTEWGEAALDTVRIVAITGNRGVGGQAFLETGPHGAAVRFRQPTRGLPHAAGGLRGRRVTGAGAPPPGGRLPTGSDPSQFGDSADGLIGEPASDDPFADPSDPFSGPPAKPSRKKGKMK